jgi:hypothetical protein
MASPDTHDHPGSESDNLGGTRVTTTVNQLGSNEEKHDQILKSLQGGYLKILLTVALLVGREVR